MTQFIKYLPCKHEDPSLVPASYIKKLGMAVHTQNLIAWGLLAGLASLAKPGTQGSGRPCLKKIRFNEQLKKSTLTSGLCTHVLMSAHKHVSIETHTV